MKTFAHNPFVHIAHKSLACLLVFCIVNMPVWALNAGDATVSAGNASVTNPASNTVSVDLISNRAVLDWTQMNATNAETLNFNGSSGFAVLNRVASAVDFNGALNGIGGHIFVVSPHGIVIGPDATITASSFTASGLNITNNNFMNNIYKFSGDGIGEVANYGDISAQQVALIGKKILNAGTISSPGGYTVLAAGDSVYLSPEGSNVVVEVASVTITADSAIDGMGDVINEGTIEAIDGQIIMAAGDTFSRAIDGIEGMSVAVESGAGTVQQLGTLVADGAEGDGGSITLTAAAEVLLGENSVTTANAEVNGDGGEVIVYSPELLTFSEGALIEAKGGSESGNGGFAEVSGLEGISLQGFANLTAANGQAGMLFIDPHDVSISDAPASPSNISTAWLENQLDFGGNTEVDTSADGIGQGNITVLNSVEWDSQYGLTLDADRDIFVNDYITNDGTGYLFLEADQHIYVNAPLSTGGDLNLFADVSGNVVGDMVSFPGATLHADGNMHIKGNNVVLGDAVDAGGNLTIKGRDCHPEDEEYEWGNVWAMKTLDAGGDIKISVTGEEKTWVPGYKEDGKWIKKHIEYSYHPGTITLDGDVTAGGDIQLYNDTYTRNVTGNGVTLTAGEDIELINDSSNPYENCTFIEGQHYLGLIAGNQIKAPSTLIGVLGSTLLMQQGPTLDTADYMFFNQGNTDLTLISDDGSVISTRTADGGLNDNAANKWNTIGATAKHNINLSGNGSITLGDSGTNPNLSLRAKNGDIDVKAGYNVLAQKNIKAGDDIRIKAKHGISLQAATAGKNMTVLADVDTYWGENVTANGKLKAGRNMTLEGSNVILKKDAEAGRDMDILAHGLYSLGGGAPGTLIGSGDVDTDGSLLAGRNMTVTAIRQTGGPANGPGFNGGSVPYNATGSILVDGDAKAKGTMGMTAGNDIIIKGDTKSGSNMTLLAGDDIRLKKNVYAGGMMDLETTGTKEANSDIELNKDGGSTVAEGNMDIDAHDDINAHGTLTSNTGTITLSSSNTTTNLYDDVWAAVDVIMNNNTWTGPGNIHIYAGDDIEGHGTITGAGSLDVEAGDNIRLRKDVDIAGNFTGLAGRDMIFNATSGDVEAGGVIDLVADRDIIGNGNVKSGGYMNLEAGRDIIIKGDTMSGGKMTMDADDDIRLKKNVSSGGDMDLLAKSTDDDSPPKDDGIELNKNGGTTYAGDKMTLEAITMDVSIYGAAASEGDMTITAGDDIYAYNTLTSNNGTVELTSSDTTTNLYDDVTAAVDIIMNNNTWTADGIKLDAGNDVQGHGTLTGAGDLDIDAGHDIKLRKNVNITGNFDGLAGNDILINENSGGLSVGGDLDLEAGDDIRLKRNVYVGKTMDLETTGAKSDSDIELNMTSGSTVSEGNMNIDAHDDIFAYSTLTSNTGSITLSSSNTTTNLYDDVTAAVDIIMNNNTWTADGIKLDAGNDVQGHGTLTGAGDLDIDAGHDIKLRKNVNITGNLDGLAGNDIIINDTSGGLSVGGDLDLEAGDDIRLKRNVYVSRTMDLKTTGAKPNDSSDIELNKKSGTTESVGTMNLDADGDIFAYSSVTSGSSMDFEAGDDILAKGKLTSTTTMMLKAGDDIDLEGTPISAQSGGTMTMMADLDPGNGTGNLTVDGSLIGNMTLSGTNVTVSGDVTSFGILDVDADENITLKKNVSSIGDMTMTAGDDITLNELSGMTSSNGSIDLMAGPIDGISKITTGTLQADGNIKAEGEQIEVNGNVDAGGFVKLVTVDDFAPGGVHSDINVSGFVQATEQVEIDSGDSVTIGSHVYSDESYIEVLANTDELSWGGIDIGGNVTTSDDDDGDITLKVIPNTGNFTPGKIAPGDIVVHGNIDSAKALTVESQQGVVLLKGNVTAENDISLQARGDNKNDPTAYDIRVLGDMETVAGSGGDITVKVIDDDIDPAAAYPDRWDDVKFDGTVTSDGKLTVETGDDIFAVKTLTSKGDMELLAGDDIHLDGTEISAQSLEGKLTIMSNLDNPMPPEGPEAKVDAAGDLLAKGDILIDASENDIFAAGNIISSEGDVDIKTGANMDGFGLQVIEATEGTVTADGFIDKIYCGELHITGGDSELAVDIAGFVRANDNIYIRGAGDVQLSGSVTAGEDCIDCDLEPDDFITLDARVVELPPRDGECCGGVSIISEDGKVYTANVDGLSVTIRGYSNDAEGQGVNLSGDPFNDAEMGKAAIIIISKEDLVLDSGTTLEAYGFYDTTGAVDDRPGMTLLEEDADIPFPDEFPRDPGEAFDVAIYLRSKGAGAETEIGQGNVFVDATVSIQSLGPDQEVCVNEGAMVIDAWDTIEFGETFEESLANGDVGDRLEVVSRITEWLEDADGRLPLSISAPPGYNYVLRGAGLENPDIEDGRAWVLESRAVPPAPLPLLALPQLKGCPAVMDAAATELAVNSDELQFLIANSMATNPNLQPCDACEKLLTAAAALKGISEETLAAMNMIFNTYAPVDAPFTPEASASIQTALADFREMDTQLATMTAEQYQEYQQYAMVDELVEAFVSYVSVLENDLKLPVGDSMALVVDKYFESIESSENPNIGSFLIEQMEAARAVGEPLIASAD